MQKILSVFGTRPEAIKLAPVIKQLNIRPNEFSSRVCVTGQHRQMLNQALDIFKIKPDYDLSIMRDNQSLSYITTGVMRALESIIQKENPDWLLVQGDTTTAMSASLTAFYNRVKVAHVEAGLRTWNKEQPFPEEMNRKIIDAVADLHFAPTVLTKENLMREGIPEQNISITGNTIVDAVLEIANQKYQPKAAPLSEIPFHKRIILVTIHRRENFGKLLRNIFKALIEIANRYPKQVHLVYPVHLNPHVWSVAQQMLGGHDNISLLAPLGYQEFIYLMKKSCLILTDSGGLQEEAPSLGKPVLILRKVTERQESLEAGIAKLVGVEPENIVKETSILLENHDIYNRMAATKNPYGDGTASLRIVESLSKYLKGYT